MKTILLKFYLLALTLSSLTASVDITVNDGHQASRRYGNDPRGIKESGYVSQGSRAVHGFDLKAFGFDSQTQVLTYVGGFDLLNGHEGWTSGDLFFNVRGGPVDVVPRPSAVDGYFNYTNPGYDFAIHFTDLGNSLAYDVYKLKPYSEVTTSFFAQNYESDPYRLVINNDLNFLFGSSTVQTTASNAQVNAMFNTDIGTNGVTNFVVEFDLSFLQGREFTVSMTQSCGNDELVGSGSSVPEASPLGACVALLGLCWFGRRK